MKVSFLGTTPPSKSNVYYSTTLSSHLSRILEVDFIGFKKLYPDFMYPGGNYDTDKKLVFAENKNLSVRKIISYYNPFSWILAGLSAKGDIAHLQWWSLPTAPIIFFMSLGLKMRGKKIIVTMHNVLPHEASIFDRMITGLALAFCDVYLVHSQKNAEQLKESFGNKEVKLVPMGVHDMYIDSEKITKAQARKWLKLPKKDVVLLVFGNLREYKGIDDIINAMEIIQNTNKGCTLVIAGEPWMDFSKYEQMIKSKRLKVKLYLKYIPHSRVKYYFVASDIVVLPYKKFEAQSGIGNVAIAFGKPVVVTNVGGLPDLVLDRIAVAEPGRPESIAKVIISIIRDKKLKKLADDSKKLAKKYSWDNVANSIVKIYEGII